MTVNRPHQTRAVVCAAAMAAGVFAVASPATAQEDDVIEDVEVALNAEEIEDVLDVAEDAADEAEDLSEYLEEQAEAAEDTAEAAEEAAEDTAEAAEEAAEDAAEAAEEREDDDEEADDGNQDDSEDGGDLARAKEALTRTLERWETEGKPGNGVASDVLTALVEGRSPADIGREHGKDVAAAMAERRAERFEARTSEDKPGKGPKSDRSGDDPESDPEPSDSNDVETETEADSGKPGNSQGKGQGGESRATGQGNSGGKSQGKGPKADR